MLDLTSSSTSRPTMRPIATTIAYYIAFVSLGMIQASLGPTLPDLAKNTGTLLSEISFLFIARSAGYLVGTFVAGRLYDRIAGHPIIIGSLIMMSLSMALVPLIPLLWLLTVILLILGIFEAILDIGGNTLLVWVHEEKVGPFMNGLHFFFGVGAFLSPLIIAAAVSRSGDITWAYWILALLILPVMLFLARLPSPTTLVETKEGTTRRPRTDYLLVGLIALFLFIYVGAEVSFGNWIYTYIVTRELASQSIAYYLTSAFWGAFTFGRLLSIPIATRLRPSLILLLDLLGALIGLLIMLIFPSLFATVIGTLLVGFSIASVFPTTISLAERNMTITGQVTSLFMVGAALGGMSWPWLIGQLFELLGPQAMIWTIIVIMLIALVIFGNLIFYTEQKRIPSPAVT